MVWYVRVKSVPKLSQRLQTAAPFKYNRDGHRVSHISVSCPISLETDLSDALYPGAATIQVQIYEANRDGWDYALTKVLELPWKGAEARVIKANLDFLIGTYNQRIIRKVEFAGNFVEKVILRVSAVANSSHRVLGQSTPEPESAAEPLPVPEFLDVWTAPYVIRLENGVNHFDLIEDYYLQRRLRFEGFWEPKSNAVDPEDFPGRCNRNTKDFGQDTNLDLQPELRLWEDGGESMARHVWDGGVALAIYLARNLRTSTDSVLSRLLFPATPVARTIDSSPPINVLELGAGVGTSGLALAQFLPFLDTYIMLTDLPDAAAILTQNISCYQLDGRAPTYTHARVQQAELDWAAVAADPIAEITRLNYEISGIADEAWKKIWGLGSKKPHTGKTSVVRARGKGPPKNRMPHSPWDLILVSDCTYNEDTLHLLVETLAAVAGKEAGLTAKQMEKGKGHGRSYSRASNKSKNGKEKAKDADGDAEMSDHEEESGPLIVLARKPRHASEEAFFSMMTARGFNVLDQAHLRLPDRSKAYFGLEEEGVDILVYR